MFCAGAQNSWSGAAPPIPSAASGNRGADRHSRAPSNGDRLAGAAPEGRAAARTLRQQAAERDALRSWLPVEE
jgi:hypothetical protein